MEWARNETGEWGKHTKDCDKINVSTIIMKLNKERKKCMNKKAATANWSAWKNRGREREKQHLQYG